MPRRSRRSRRPRATPEGFKWQGNKLVPLEGTTFNEETQEWEVGKKQSGNDWGMEDPLEGSGSDIMDMDPNSPEFAVAVQADTDAGPPTLPGEVDESGWSSDFTDSGQQTSSDPEDTDEEETEEAGYIPEGIGQSLLSPSGSSGSNRSSSIGGGYGKKRIAQQSRGQMNLTSGSNRSILTS